MKKTRKTVLVLLAVILIFALSGCATTADNQSSDVTKQGTETEVIANELEAESDEITLTLWHLWAADTESFKAPIEKAIADFEVEYPNIHLEVDAVENESYKTRLKTSLAANETSDIFYAWGGGFSKPFIDAGKILILDPYIEDSTYDRMIGRGESWRDSDGNMYGLSFSMSIGVFYCNQELFDQIGAEIPTTYTELLEVSKLFNEAGIIPMTVGEKDLWPGMFYYDVLALRTAGADLCTDALNKTASFNQAPFIEAGQMLTTLVEDGVFDPGVMALTRDEAEADFRQGKVAMYFNGSWVAGSLSGEDVPVDGKIVCTKFPILEGGQGTDTEFFGGSSTSDGFMVSADTEYPEEAALVAQYLAEHLSLEAYKSGASLPVWIHEDVDTSSIDPLMLEIAELTTDATGFVPWWDVYLEGEDAEIHKDLVAQLFAGLITPEDYGMEMQKLNE